MVLISVFFNGDVRDDNDNMHRNISDKSFANNITFTQDNRTIAMTFSCLNRLDLVAPYAKAVHNAVRLTY